MLKASMSINQERPFYVPIYALKRTHAMISSEPTQVPTPRFYGDPRVLKYFDIYASQDDLLVEDGSADGTRNLASPLSLSLHLLISYLYFIIVFYYAQLPQ
jgi:hypothetical protein